MRVERKADEVMAKEQAYDLQWIRENMYLFDPLARDGFALVGRGAMVVNLNELTLRRNYEEGHPFNYRSTERLADWFPTEELTHMSQAEPVADLLAAHNPAKEMVVVLVKHLRGSAYQIPLLDEDELDQEIRGAYVEAEAEERHDRLTGPDTWGRDFRLATRHLAIWPVKQKHKIT